MAQIYSPASSRWHKGYGNSRRGHDRSQSVIGIAGNAPAGIAAAASQLVVHFLCFGEDELFRVVGIAAVHGGGFHVLIARMTVPQHDDLAGNACFLAAGDVGVAQLMGVMVREQPFERRTQFAEVHVFRGVKVDKRLHPAEHRGEGDRTQRHVPAHALLARLTFEEAVCDVQRDQLALPQPEI